MDGPYRKCFTRRNRNSPPIRRTMRRNSGTPRSPSNVVSVKNRAYLNRQTKKCLYYKHPRTKKSRALYSRGHADCGSAGGQAAPLRCTDGSVAKVLHAMGMTPNTKCLIHWVGTGDGRESMLAASLTRCCVDALEINQDCIWAANHRVELLKQNNKVVYESLNGRLKFRVKDALDLRPSTIKGRVIHTTAIAGQVLDRHLLKLALYSPSVKILSMFHSHMDNVLPKAYLQSINARFKDVRVSLSGGAAKTQRILFLTETLKKRIVQNIAGGVVGGYILRRRR